MLHLFLYLHIIFIWYVNTKMYINMYLHIFILHEYLIIIIWYVYVLFYLIIFMDFIMFMDYNYYVLIFYIILNVILLHLFLCTYVHAHSQACIRSSQKTTCKSCFSPSTMWNWGDQACWPLPLPDESSYWPSYFYSLHKCHRNACKSL